MTCSNSAFSDCRVNSLIHHLCYLSAADGHNIYCTLYILFAFFITHDLLPSGLEAQLVKQRFSLSRASSWVRFPPISENCFLFLVWFSISFIELRLSWKLMGSPQQLGFHYIVNTMLNHLCLFKKKIMLTERFGGPLVPVANSMNMRLYIYGISVFFSFVLVFFFLVLNEK